MKKLFLNVMMLLAVAITTVCACGSDVDTVKPDDPTEQPGGSQDNPSETPDNPSDTPDDP